MSAFRDPRTFPFTAQLEAAFPTILGELQQLDAAAFAPAPDSLTTIEGRYDETGWLWLSLVAAGGAPAPALARCPATARALAAIPALHNAGFSRFLPGTHLYPHHGELPGVLRCHLALIVPRGDCAIRFGDETRGWQPGHCLVFDDTLEHEAWNRGDGPRTVLLITFATHHQSP